MSYWPPMIRFADFRSQVAYTAAYLQQPHPLVARPLVVITGPPRSGKSTLAKHLLAHLCPKTPPENIAPCHRRLDEPFTIQNALFDGYYWLDHPRPFLSSQKTEEIQNLRFLVTSTSITYRLPGQSDFVTRPATLQIVITADTDPSGSFDLPEDLIPMTRQVRLA